MTVQSLTPRCFSAARPSLSGSVACNLQEEAARALATLLPILGCGEEAAGLAFADLAVTETLDTAAAFALRRIAEEEEVHDGLLHALAAALPTPPEQRALRARTRRFHLELGRGVPASRLARIAALDSAVCFLLSRLLRPGSPLAADRATATILRRIARDEARHVRVTRGLAMGRLDESQLRSIGAPVRVQLGALLSEVGEAFDTLGFDPRWLRGELSNLPSGLYRP